MRKNIKMATALMIAAIVALSVGLMAGCKPRNPNVIIDKNKTQLHVGNYNGGFGGEWLKKLKVRFEDYYANDEFEEGKTGVQVIIEGNKTIYHGAQLLDNTKTSHCEVFFSEAVTYRDFVSRGNMLEITDIMESDLPEETATIYSKLNDAQKTFYNLNDKFYAVPHYQAYRGLIYDYDLFEEYALFINKDGGYTDDPTKFSAGPDGDLTTTYDNGMPATYAEFFALCNYMKNQLSIQPISWAGDVLSTYTKYLIDALHADYEGYDSYNILRNFGQVAGKDTTFIIEDINDLDVNGKPKQKEVTVTPDNYLSVMSKQAGMYYALEFMKQIIENKYYTPLSINTTQKHTMAQSDFLYSRFESGTQPIAMLLDGIWWEEEAGSVFKDMETLYQDDAKRENRRFAFMPLPKADESKLGSQTLFDGNYSMAYINGKLTDAVKIDLAKKFIMFSCTDESLKEFAEQTGTSRDFIFEMGDSYNNMSFFGKSVYDIVSRGDVCYTYSQGRPSNISSADAVALLDFNSKIDGKTKTVPVNAFLYDKVGGQYITAEQYFSGIAAVFN